VLTHIGVALSVRGQVARDGWALLGLLLLFLLHLLFGLLLLLFLGLLLLDLLLLLLVYLLLLFFVLGSLVLGGLFALGRPFPLEAPAAARPLGQHARGRGLADLRQLLTGQLKTVEHAFDDEIELAALVVD